MLSAADSRGSAASASAAWGFESPPISLLYSSGTRSMSFPMVAARVRTAWQGPVVRCVSQQSGGVLPIDQRTAKRGSQESQVGQVTESATAHIKYSILFLRKLHCSCFFLFFNLEEAPPPPCPRVPILSPLRGKLRNPSIRLQDEEKIMLISFPPPPFVLRRPSAGACIFSLGRSGRNCGTTSVYCVVSLTMACLANLHPKCADIIAEGWD